MALLCKAIVMLCDCFWYMYTNKGVEPVSVQYCSRLNYRWWRYCSFVSLFIDWLLWLHMVIGGFDVLHEHIGEAAPLVNDACTNPFLVPNKNRTMCILPQRIDLGKFKNTVPFVYWVLVNRTFNLQIGKHFILTGGPDAIREDFELMVDRLTSFGRYIFDIDKYSAIRWVVSYRRLLFPLLFSCFLYRNLFSDQEFQVLYLITYR